MKAKEFPSLVKLMDEGVQKVIDNETADWNERKNLERFPLSPSQIGKCGLALARNLSHYLGLGNYPRANDSIQPRTRRIFARGDLLEDALIADMGSHAKLRVESQQTRVRLFPLSREHAVEGNIDGILVAPDGTRILVDFKSKGAFYSANFSDSIQQFFREMRTTGLVEEFHENSFFITDPKALFDTISLDEFFVDYLLQLNAYAFAEGVKVDFVALYYENKNTCANYEVRWVPHQALFDYAKTKFQYIYDTTRTQGAEAVPKEFGLGTSRCRLCEYNERCYGKYEPKPPVGRNVGTLPDVLDRALRAVQRDHHVAARVEEDALRVMEQKGLTHITTSDGLTYERKFLKSPKPHYELRLSK